MINGGGINGRLLNGGSQGLPIVSASGTFTVSVLVSGSPRLADRGVASVKATATVQSASRKALRGTGTAHGAAQIQAEALITQVATFVAGALATANPTQYHRPPATFRAHGTLDPLATRVQQARATARISGKTQISYLTVSVFPVFRGQGRMGAYALRNGVHEVQGTFRTQTHIQTEGNRRRNVRPTFRANAELSASPLPGRGSGATAKVNGTLAVRYFAKRPDHADLLGTANVTAEGTRVVLPLVQIKGTATIDHLASRQTWSEATIDLDVQVTTKATRMKPSFAEVRGYAYARSEGRLGIRGDSVLTGVARASADGVRLALVYPTFVVTGSASARSRLNLQLPAPKTRTLIVPDSPRLLVVPTDLRVLYVPGPNRQMEL